MKDTAALAARINHCFKANAYRAVFATGVLLISQILIIFCVFALVQTMPSLFALPLLILAGIFLLLVQYGFSVIMYKLYTRRRAIIGDLFSGFRDIRRVGGAAVIFFAIDCGVCLLCVIFALAFRGAFPGMVTGLSRLVLTAMLFYGVCILLALLPFAFVWLELFSNPQMRSREAFKKSARLMRGHKLHLLELCLRAGGISLLIALGLYVLNFVLFTPVMPDLSVLGITAEAGALVVPETKTALPGMVSALIDMVYYIASVIALIKALLSNSALYTELTHPSVATPELPPQKIDESAG
ncbi:MAG: hypothetical protein LBS97_06285 [Treponema sp.]|jgi:hypothetical protein|nr:hypothetical protein [Treponema sp.]